MMPSRYAMPKPAQIKRSVAGLKHVSAPLKGLSLSSKLVQGDPLTAVVLDNWVVEENQVKARAGTRLTYTHAAGHAIEQLVPYYGQAGKLAMATNGEIRLLDGTLVRAGFLGNDWAWTAFANLSAINYTVMVNGKDGVWSWDGGSVPDPAAVPVVSLSNTNPAVVTVSAANIAKFSNGMPVVIAGAVGTGMVNANGTHLAASVGVPANTFVLSGVDTSGGAAPQTTGVTADPPGSMAKQGITSPDTWVVPDQFDKVLAHQNRLWFADSANLAIYYLDVQVMSGVVHSLPLNAIFKRGGTIRALYTWTTDGGINLNDQLVVFTSNGEAAIFSGVDPTDPQDFGLTGVFRFDAPMSKHSVVNYGGDLYCLISTGLVPMSTLMRAETEQLGTTDRNVFSNFFAAALNHRDSPGWQAMVNPSSGRLIANMPLGGINTYQQMVRFMPAPVWATWSALPSRCWGWIDNRLFFGSDDGKVYEMHPDFLNDDGDPIKVDVQAAWSNYGTPASKHFKMVYAYMQSDGTPQPFIDMKVDYDMSAPTNQPDVTFSLPGADWDTATWDVADWAGTVRSHNNWSGVGVIGRVGGPRLVALIRDCHFSLTGWDVEYETGSIFG
jgi:hypothetical protein